jgi:hypothetical protein
MSDKTNMNSYLTGVNGDLWESWLIGDSTPAELLYLLKERHAETTEITFAEASIAIDSAYLETGKRTIDKIAGNTEFLCKAATVTESILESEKESVQNSLYVKNIDAPVRGNDINSKSAREQAVVFLSQHFNESMPADGFIVPSIVGLIATTLAFVGIITSQPQFIWTAVGCGSLLGCFYVVRSLNDSVWNVGTIRF